MEGLLNSLLGLYSLWEDLRWGTLSLIKLLVPASGGLRVGGGGAVTDGV